MGLSISKPKPLYSRIMSEAEEIKSDLKKKGVVGAKNLLKGKLAKFRDEKIRIGVTGTSGVGKSSFINAFRGIDENDERAANSSIIETKNENEAIDYNYPDDPRIILVDLQMINGEINEINKNISSEEFKSCHMFLVLSETRFRNEELQLVKEIKNSLKKPFLFVRTKMDLVENSEIKRKNRDMEDVMREIREDCRKNLKNLGIRDDEIFLVSSRFKDKWDFRPLLDVINKRLPSLQKDASTRVVMNESRTFVENKVKILRGRLWRVKLIFSSLFLLDIIACGFISHLISKCQIKKKTKFYRSQLGLPKKDSEEFQEMKQEFKEKMEEFYAMEEKECACCTCCGCCEEKEEKCTCCICCAWKHTIDSLNQTLSNMENLSLKILDDAAIGIEQTSEEGSSGECTHNITLPEI